MTEDRKEPTLSPLKPDPDEIEQRQQRSGAKSPGATPPGAKPDAPRESARAHTGPQRPVVVRSSKLAPFAFLLAITGLGLAGFAYWQLLEAQKDTQAAVARIADLEERLEMTGDESEASMAAVQAKLKWADSEIRKLWGVSYDTNRKAIAENKTAIAAVNNQVSAVKKQVSAVENKLNASLNDVRSDVKKVSSTIDSLQAKLNEAEQARLQLQKQTQEVADAMRQLREQQSALQGRVRTNEQAIEAIDTFRRSVNRDILELKSKVPAPASGTTP
jgi:methyl-accepting chemotaxis protein